MKLAILMYHRVEELPAAATHPGNYVRPRQFREQLDALRSWGYEPIALEDWIAYRDGARELPRRPVVLTFDDGYRSMLDTWPVIRAHGFTATTFLVSSCIGGTNHWETDGRQESLLSGDEILQLHRAGMRFGSHTRSHRRLGSLTEAEAERELSHSRRELESLLGEPVRSLAYPFSNQNAHVRALARRAGYTVAVRGRGRMNRRGTDAMALYRIKVDVRTTVSDLRWMLFRERWLRP